MEDLTHQIGNLRLGEIAINYADGLTASVKEVDILRGILAGKERSDVVMFGEGHFTFSMALASLRKSWNGITATRYEPVSHDNPKPEFTEVKVKTIQYCIVNGETFGDPSDAILSKVKMVINLPSPPRPDDTWQFDVDATRIPDELDVQGKVVWFQCPWAWHSDDLSRLLVTFLQHMASKQDPGDYTLLGIANLFPYVKNYKLEELLGENLARGHVHGYEFLGADRKFVRELLQYGYKHEGCKDIHNGIIEYHITLVFRK